MTREGDVMISAEEEGGGDGVFEETTIDMRWRTATTETFCCECAGTKRRRRRSGRREEGAAYAVVRRPCPFLASAVLFAILAAISATAPASTSGNGGAVFVLVVDAAAAAAPPPPQQRPTTSHSSSNNSGGGIKGRTADHSDSTAARAAAAATTATAAQLQRTRVIQIAETEVYDGKSWKAPGSLVVDYGGGGASGGNGGKKTPTPSSSSSSSSSSHRWTDALTGNASPPPDQFSLDSLDDGNDEHEHRYRWDGDWKIVAAGHRDEFGWEYEFSTKVRRRESGGGGGAGASAADAGRWGMPTRRRIWLRTCVLVEDEEQEGSSAGAAKLKKAQQKKRKKGKKRRSAGGSRLLASALARQIRDDFNFKGFGFSFYKSLVFGKSVGVAIRLPLTYNFGVWESHPGFPSVSTNVAFYGPSNPTIGIFLSASLRMEMIAWLLGAAASTASYCAAWFLWTFLVQGLVLAASALMFPVTRKLAKPDLLLPRRPECWTVGPQYKRTVEERVGCSLSWRVSVQRGFEFRRSFWHFYAPTVASIADYCAQQRQAVARRASLSSVDSSGGSEKRRGGTVASLPTWVLRRAAALGISTSGPIPDEPFLTSSALLSLSGFYFKKEGSSNRQKEQPLPLPTATPTAKVSSSVLRIGTEGNEAQPDKSSRRRKADGEDESGSLSVEAPAKNANGKAGKTAAVA